MKTSVMAQIVLMTADRSHSININQRLNNKLSGAVKKALNFKEDPVLVAKGGLEDNIAYITTCGSVVMVDVGSLGFDIYFSEAVSAEAKSLHKLYSDVVMQEMLADAT